MRAITPALLGLLALTACEPTMPDSGAGVGFGDYQSYMAAREAQLAGETVQPDPQAISGETVQAAPESAVVTPSHAGISDEQSFAAVSERETIASDAARIEENREQYVIIEPTALPPRPDGSGASIVEYALRTNNAVGVQLYSRSGFNAQSRFERNCAKYGSQDAAQEAFLDAGGPQRDPKGLDPDGDGFACYWDPTPFRMARAAAQPADDVIGMAGAALDSVDQ